MRRSLATLCLLAISSLPAGLVAEPVRSVGADEIESAATLNLWTLYEATLEANPNILAAQARIHAGEGRRQEARGRLFPQVAATASLTRNQRDDGRFRDYYHGERYALQFNQVLFDSASWRGFQRFSALADQLKAEAANVTAQMTVDLVHRYFAVLAAEDELELTQAERRLTQRNFERVNALFERQLARITDVLDISARVDRLLATEVEAANEVAVAREALAELVGWPVTAKLQGITDAAPLSVPDQDQEHWVALALHHNAALAARNEAVAAAEAAVGEAKGAYLPTVQLFAMAQESDIGYDNTLAPQAETYVVGLGLQIPLFTGGATSGRVKTMHGALAEARHQYEAARREVVRETRTAFLTLQASNSRLKATENALASAIKAREAAERSFSYGLNTAVDVLAAVREEYAARRDHLGSRYSFVINWLGLNRWAGTAGREQVKQVNSWLADE
jgi:outer membrane protein